MLKNLYLVRHGQSLGNVSPDNYSKIPDWKIPLSDEGSQQASNAGVELSRLFIGMPISAYYSPMVRAKQTYLAIRDSITSNIMFEREEPLVSEQSFGMINSYSDLFGNADMMKARQEYGSFYYCPPDGESGLDVLMRVKRFLDEVEKRGHENALVVSHGSFIKVLMMELLDWSVNEFDEFKRPDNCRILYLEKDERYDSWSCFTKLEYRNKKIESHDDYA